MMSVSKHIIQVMYSTAEHLMLDPTDIASIKGGFNGQESYCFLVNPDGTMSVFYSARAEERAGWMLWSTRANQKFHSVTVVDRRVFCISMRDEGDGTNRYYLEEFLEICLWIFVMSFQDRLEFLT